MVLFFNFKKMAIHRHISLTPSLTPLEFLLTPFSFPSPPFIIWGGGLVQVSRASCVFVSAMTYQIQKAALLTIHFSCDIPCTFLETVKMSSKGLRTLEIHTLTL